MASVSWQSYYGKCSYDKCIYGKSIMENVTEPSPTLQSINTPYAFSLKYSENLIMRKKNNNV